jgi:hypothetical protein
LNSATALHQIPNPVDTRHGVGGFLPRLEGQGTMIPAVMNAVVWRFVRAHLAGAIGR